MKNSYKHLGNGITEIYIVRRNGDRHVCLIDTEDFDKVDEYGSWVHSGTGHGYVMSNYGRVSGRQVNHKMHRVVMECLGSLLAVDHINHNRMDNRKCNLRLVTTSENLQNRSGPCSNSVSGERGVTWYPPTNSWKATLKVEGKNMHLGYFNTIYEASEIVKAARSKLMTHSSECGIYFDTQAYDDLDRMRLRRNNTSGHKGLSWKSPNNAWQVNLNVRGYNKYIGIYKEKEDAIQAYQDALHKYYPEKFTEPFKEAA